MQEIITRKPLAWFKVNPQTRQNLGSEVDLRNLGRSLRERQLSPVGATADATLIYGHRRLKAAELEGLPDLEVKIYPAGLSPVEVKLIQIIENFQREDLSAFERWQACEQLRILNPEWQSKELAEHLKLEASTVTKLLSPSKCIPAWRELLEQGRATISDCYAASRVSEEQQRELLALKLGGASRDGLERVVRKTKAKGTSKDGALNRVTIQLPSGRQVVVRGRGMSLTAVVEALSESVDAAKKAIRDRLDARTWQSVMRDKSRAEDDHV